MIRLHGFAVSNYFNMVRMALLEKGAEFSIETAYPSQEASYLGRSPLGKVPCLETDAGFLSETSVILDYIEETFPEPHFYPSDAFARAQVRQAIKMMELYVELPARRLYPGVFFGATNAESTVTEVEPLLRKGMAGLASVLKCSPFLMGNTLGHADFFCRFHVSAGERGRAQGVELGSGCRSTGSEGQPGATERPQIRAVGQRRDEIVDGCFPAAHGRQALVGTRQQKSSPGRNSRRARAIRGRVSYR